MCQVANGLIYFYFVDIFFKEIDLGEPIKICTSYTSYIQYKELEGGKLSTKGINMNCVLCANYVSYFFIKYNIFSFILVLRCLVNHHSNFMYVMYLDRVMLVMCNFHIIKKAKKHRVIKFTDQGARDRAQICFKISDCLCFMVRKIIIVKTFFTEKSFSSMKLVFSVTLDKDSR